MKGGPLWAAALGSVGVLAGVLVGCGEAATPSLQRIVRVPQDFSSIGTAVEHVRPGGLVLIDRGTYRESVTVRTKDVTVRGVDRNAVILDGEGKRSNGVVAAASGVVVENLTVQRYLLNGVLVTGMVDEGGAGIGRGSDGYHRLDTEKFPPIPDFLVRYVTAVDNGLYGVYAFNRRHGTIEHSYASGSSDAGFYVGQCVDCDITVVDNVAEFNAVGYESANSSGVTVVRNRFSRNRVGLTFSSDYQEAYAPQRQASIVGNLVADNNESGTPEQADGGFGIGIGLAGTEGVEVLRNRVVGNDSAGLLLAPAEDLPAIGNIASGNVLAGNGTDLAVWSSVQSGGTRPNCLTPRAIETLYPVPFRPGLRCGDRARSGAPVAPFRTLPAPPGIPFLDVPPPGPQPTMPGNPADARFGRAQAPEPFDLDVVAVPPRSLHGESVR